MFDHPPAGMILDEVRAALDAGIATGFHQKVAANALGICIRELDQGPALAAAERARLARLLGRDDGPAALNVALAGEIDRGVFADDDPALLDHLIRTSVAKIGVDQPGYAAFRMFRERGRTAVKEK